MKTLFNNAIESSQLFEEIRTYVWISWGVCVDQLGCVCGLAGVCVCGLVVLYQLGCVCGVGMCRLAGVGVWTSWGGCADQLGWACAWTSCGGWVCGWVCGLAGVGVDQLWWVGVWTSRGGVCGLTDGCGLVLVGVVIYILFYFIQYTGQQDDWDDLMKERSARETLCTKLTLDINY